MKKKQTVLIIGQYLGYGGVQTIHKDLENVYKSRGYNVQNIYNLNSLIRIFFNKKIKIKIVYFSGLSIVFAPLFFKCKKQIFLTHGFYIFEEYNFNIYRFFKKFIYEFVVFFSLFIYRWIICIAPSPISGLINSIKFSRKIYIVPWGVNNQYIKDPIPNENYKYHLTFLGRANSQKLNIIQLEDIIKIILKSKIINKKNNLYISFVIPKFNKHSKYIINYLKENYDFNIDIHIGKSNSQIRSILSETLYYFNCYEWEAFGLTNIEALCMGCNILIPSTSPILPIVESIKNAPVYKYHARSLLSKSNLKNNLKLSKKRPSNKYIEYYRSLFNWDTIINEIHKIINL